MTDRNNNCRNGLSVAKEKLIDAIKRIQHELDECREEECEMYIQSVGVENCFDVLEREVRSEFQNLHRFLDEEESLDLERLRKARQKQVKQLRGRERKIAEQGKDLERAVTTLSSKLAEEDSPKLLKVHGKLRPPTRGRDRGPSRSICGPYPIQNMEAYEKLPLSKHHGRHL
ncbi:unnamed protein product [Arctogadus glacialis]